MPTVEGFAAMKLAAWEDRQAPRDLFDLAGLTTLDAFTAGTLEVFVELCGRLPDPQSYRRVSAATGGSWQSQLAHQAAGIPDAARCLRLVSNAVDAMQR